MLYRPVSLYHTISLLNNKFVEGNPILRSLLIFISMYTYRISVVYREIDESVFIKGATVYQPFIHFILRNIQYASTSGDTFHLPKR